MIVTLPGVTLAGNRIRLMVRSDRINLYIIVSKAIIFGAKMKSENFKDISFDKKIRIFSQEYLSCCVYLSNFDTSKYVFTEKLYTKLLCSSQILEDFLDFHGAKNSSNWFFYRELSAAVRHLSRGSYYQKQISNRLASYSIDNIDEFTIEGYATLDFLTQTLIDLAPVILDEAKRLNIPIPDKGFDPADFPGIATTTRFDYDIVDQDKIQQKKNVVKIASKFLSIAREFDQFEFFESFSLAEILDIVPDKINEVVIMRFEMQVHNLQSTFDTYVNSGGYKYGDKKLKKFRDISLIIFRLLQTTGRLLHFYERHLHDAGYKDTYKHVQDRLSSLIEPDALLDRTINFGLYYICHFFSLSKDLAQEILNENIERSSIAVGIPVELGFHSRPSMMVAKIVQHYGGEVEMRVGNDKFDASSVLDIQWAGGKIQKENIQEVIFEGDSRSLHDIEILASVNYGEDSMGKGVPLPAELKHLR